MSLEETWGSVYRFNPAEFGRRVIPWRKPGPWESWSGWWPWQEDLLKGVGQELHGKDWGPAEDGAVTPRDPVQRVICSSSSSGKTSAVLPLLIAWGLTCWPRMRTIVVSTTATQLMDRLFGACKVLIDSSPELTRILAHAESGRIWRRDAPAVCHATFRTAETAEALAGLHSQSGQVMVIFDEASGPPDKIWDATSGARSDPQAIVVLAGNPTRGEGFFWRRHTGPLASRWHPVFVSQEDLPGWSEAKRADLIAEHGSEDSPTYRAYVLGRPPLPGSAGFIPLARIEEAMARPLRDRLNQPIQPADTPLVVGMDLARAGEDRPGGAWNAAFFRAGVDGRSVPPERVRGLGADARADWAIGIAETPRPPYGAPAIVYYDATGLEGSFEELLDRKAPDPSKFVPVDFGAPDPRKRCVNKRAVMWAALSRWLGAGGVLPPDRGLANTIAAARPVWSNNGRLGISKKEEIESAVGSAHLDTVDALLLSMGRPRESSVVSPALKIRTGAERSPRWTS